MAWKCPQCGEINRNNSCIRCVCGYEITEQEQTESHVDLSEAISLKPSQTKDIISAIIFMFVLYGILSAMLPKSDFIDYYAWISVQCIIIYLLYRKYPLKLLPIINFGKACKYGIGLGIIVLAINFFSYIKGSSRIPDDYNIFVNYTLFKKYLFFANRIMLTPIVEEILFRGFFYRILKDRYGIFIAGLSSILLFAAVHNFEASGFVHGFIFTYVYEKSDTFWGSVITHTMNNFAYGFFHYLV